MCRKNYYIILDRKLKPLAVAESYEDLNMIVTGMGLDLNEHIFPKTTRSDARLLNKELSDRVKLPNASIN